MNVLKIRNEMRSGKSIFDLPLRVTFYARVSTDKDEQLNSLENQVQYYTELIQSKPNWTYIPGYIDEGISGTSTRKRDSFLRMISDAKAGRFDFIITKEISRFSRSTLDSIQYTQELLEHDVGVLFQNDNINTLDSDSEFRLVVMAGVAQDEAFCFTYRDNLQLLQDLGAELVPFSPLADAGLPENLQGLILSGGYPELHAARLAENASMREAVREAVQGGLPCIAECGGFLYLHRTLEGEDGKDYPMAGVLSARAYRTPRLSRFGYITLTAKEDQLLLAKGEEIRGHEFHYWESESCGETMRAQKPLRKRGWDCVHGAASLYAGFPHLFFYSNPDAALRFLEKCEERLC